MPTLDETLNERGSRYGDFADHARIAQNLQDAMRRTAGWSRLQPMHKQALTTIADKIARILNGDPDYLDNWHDIQGYARLVEQRLALPRDTTPSTRALFDNSQSLDWRDLSKAEVRALRKNGTSVFREDICRELKASPQSNNGPQSVDPRTKS